jgi:hypothetical protein
MRKFTVVDWWDPSDNNSGWISKEDTRSLAKAELITTYGEIIDEDEIHLKLAFNYCGKDGYVHTTGVVTKSSIYRRKDYKFPWKTSPMKPEKSTTSSQSTTSKST